MAPRDSDKKSSLGDFAAPEPEPAAVSPEAAERPSEPLSDIFLSKLLKMGTQSAHKAAESGSFVKRLLRGRVPLEEYRLLLVDLRHAYEALESGLEAAANVKQCQVVQAIHHPTELSRLSSLRQDVEFWFRSEPEALAATMPSKAAQAYAARIREIAETAPHLLVAHAYTRYLGDLSGGMVIKRSICRAMPVGEEGEGVRFYDFQNVSDAKSFKQKYRDQLDCLDVLPAVAEEIVQEANKAFDFNSAIFRYLDERAGISESPGAAEPQLGTTGELPAGHPPVREGAVAQCPFAALAASERDESQKGEMLARPRGLPAGHPEVPVGALQCPFANLAASGAGASDAEMKPRQKQLPPAPETAPPSLLTTWKQQGVKAAGAVLAAAGAFLAVPLPTAFSIVGSA
jgi:heme oxygenase